MKNIVLTGFMGTGKTAVGRYLAKRLGFAYLDIDREIERVSQKTITEIFKTQGEEAFRDLESEVIGAASLLSNTVISTGGGAVIRQDNVSKLREKGIIVCLDASAETVFERVKNNKDRPLLNTDDPLQRIRELMAERKVYYQRADFIVNTEGLSPAQVVDNILKLIR